MKNKTIRITFACLLIAGCLGCVFSEHVILPAEFYNTTNKLNVVDGTLIVPNIEKRMVRTLFYHPGFAITPIRHGGPLYLPLEYALRAPTIILELLFDELNTWEWKTTERFPVFEPNVSHEVEVVRLSSMVGKQIELSSKSEMSTQENIVISFEKCRIDHLDHVRIKSVRPTLDDVSEGQKELGVFFSLDVMFILDGQIYVLSDCCSYRAKWLFFSSYSDWELFKYFCWPLEPDHILTRIDPFTGNSDVLVKYDKGDIIIDNSTTE